MDIKEAAGNAMMKENELGSKIESEVKRILEDRKDGCSSLYQIPEDSDCVKDIMEVSNLVTDRIKKIIMEWDASNAEKSISLCSAAIDMLAKYRNTRLNIEVGNKFKYETLPSSNTLHGQIKG